MLNINPDNKKMILSIDGGGMRGMIALGMLAELEKMTGKPAYELFDMVAGTSTGAIIAAGLCVGKNASDILAIYKTDLPQAFGTQQGIGFWLNWLFTGLRYFYPLEPFRKALQPIVEGKKIRDLTKPIIFMTTKDVRTSNNYFIVSKGPGAAAFGDWPVSGAVAASGAAPIYFPPAANNLIDGGVGVYGNPSLAAAIEAMEYIGASEGFEDGKVRMISLGTGYPPNQFGEGAAAKFWLKDWIEYIIGENIDDSGLQQVYLTRAIYKDRMDFRRYNPLLTTKSITEKLGIPVPAGIKPELLSLDTRTAAELQFMEDIGRAYARKIDWTLPGIMPWDTVDVGGHFQPNRVTMQIDWSKTTYK